MAIIPWSRRSRDPAAKSTQAHIPTYRQPPVRGMGLQRLVGDHLGMAPKGHSSIERFVTADLPFRFFFQVGIGMAERQPGARRRRAVGSLLACLVLSSCGQGPLDPHGPVGSAERVILYDATGIMLAVVIPVIVLTLVFAWWFRSGNQNATYKPEWKYSGRIELIIWAIPALVVLFLGGMAWIASHALDPPKALESQSPALEVQVISLDWRWLFIYPHEGIATVNYLVVPVDVPVHFRLTSTSVMNSFFIPQLGSQIYTMPGMTTQLNLLADKPGAYPGLSAQFSGPGFSDMRFTVRAEASEDFARWVAQARGQGNALDSMTVTDLMRPTKDSAERTYGSVPDDPFEAIAGGHLKTRWSVKEAL
jgi:cytochrome o ubiquinol oxidase subunit 2